VKESPKSAPQNDRKNAMQGARYRHDLQRTRQTLVPRGHQFLNHPLLRHPHPLQRAKTILPDSRHEN